MWQRKRGKERQEETERMPPSYMTPKFPLWVWRYHMPLLENCSKVDAAGRGCYGNGSSDLWFRERFGIWLIWVPTRLPFRDLLDPVTCITDTHAASVHSQRPGHFRASFPTSLPPFGSIRRYLVVSSIWTLKDPSYIRGQITIDQSDLIHPSSEVSQAHKILLCINFHGTGGHVLFHFPKRERKLLYTFSSQI